MNCRFQRDATGDHVCPECRTVLPGTLPTPIYRECFPSAADPPGPPPPSGPGRQLHALLSSLGLASGCAACDELARQMDIWGPDGCDANRETVLAGMRQRAAAVPLPVRARAFASAALRGLWISPRDPAGSILDEALRLARAAEATAPGAAALATGGIGDWLTVEAWLRPDERRRLRTLYFATSRARQLAELDGLLPKQVFPRLETEQSLWDDWREIDCFCSRGQLAARRPPPAGSDWADIQDWSISRIFAEISSGLRRWQGSSWLRHELPGVARAAQLAAETGRFALVNAATLDNRPAGRNFCLPDWTAALALLERRRLVGIIVGHQGPEMVPASPRLRDLRGRTTLGESIELLRAAEAFLGVDSWLSVLAAERFAATAAIDVRVKSTRENGARLHAYAYYPAAAASAPDWLLQEIRA